MSLALPTGGGQGAAVRGRARGSDAEDAVAAEPLETGRLGHRAGEHDWPDPHVVQGGPTGFNTGSGSIMYAV